MATAPESHQKLTQNNNQHSKRRKLSLEETYKDLNRNHVKIKTKDRRCNNSVLNSVLGKFLKIMQNHDTLFKRMKPKLDYLGSYYDGLRVGPPTEYDINVILNLPVNYDKIYLDARKTAYDCTNIVMSSEFRRLSKAPATVHEGFKETRMWCDDRYRLSVKIFRSWMQGVVDTAVASLPSDNNKKVIHVNNRVYAIATKISGPACTVTIIPEGSDGDTINKAIDVDLVPTFAFELSKKPIGSKVLFKFADSLNVKKQYFLVPKPTDDEFSWRLSFPFQERYYISNKNNLKSTAKLVKLLRDTQGFKQLASYYIKTIFLWECQRQNNYFWKRKSLSYLVLHMLRILKYCLAEENIKNFWCPEINLIKDKIKSETCQNWSNRLGVIIKNIEHKGKYNPTIILQYFSKNIGK